MSDLSIFYHSAFKDGSFFGFFDLLQNYFDSKVFKAYSFELDECVQFYPHYDEDVDSLLRDKMLNLAFAKPYFYEETSTYLVSLFVPEMSFYKVFQVKLSQKEFAHKMTDDFLAVLDFYREIFKLKGAVDKYKQLSLKDEITGLYNQRKLYQDLEFMIHEHAKKQECFSMLFVDIDHFKYVNDHFGHVVGSKMLSQMGGKLKELLRKSDLVYRYGGDEYIILMPSISIETVHQVGMRVLEKIKEMEFEVGRDEPYKLSVSIGIAQYPTDATSAEDIINFADKMMYLSKESGRGKVFHINEVHGDPFSS